MNAVALSAKQIAQSGIIPNTQVAPQAMTCIGLTPAVVKQSLAQSHHGPGVGGDREVLTMQGLQEQSESGLGFGDILCANLIVESRVGFRIPLCKKVGASSSEFPL